MPHSTLKEPPHLQALNNAVILNERIILLTNQKAEKLKNTRSQRELRILQLRDMYQSAFDRRLEFEEERKTDCFLIATQTFLETYREDLESFRDSSFIKDRKCKGSNQHSKKSGFLSFFVK